MYHYASIDRHHLVHMHMKQFLHIGWEDSHVVQTVWVGLFVCKGALEVSIHIVHGHINVVLLSGLRNSHLPVADKVFGPSGIYCSNDHITVGLDKKKYIGHPRLHEEKLYCSHRF